MSVIVQYVGFKAKAIVREYSFRVRESSIEPHAITFTILNKVFTSRHLSFQNAPDICSLKLHRELKGSVNNRLKKHYRISETELDDYRTSHSKKVANTLHSHPSNILGYGYHADEKVTHKTSVKV
jgi:hypothetical protein